MSFKVTHLHSHQTPLVLLFIEWESVISDTTIILSMDSDNIKMIYSRGNASMRLGNYQEAFADFNVALTLSPSEPEMDMLNRNIVICAKHLPVSIDVSDDLKFYEAEDPILEAQVNGKDVSVRVVSAGMFVFVYKSIAVTCSFLTGPLHPQTSLQTV